MFMCVCFGVGVCVCSMCSMPECEVSQAGIPLHSENPRFAVESQNLAKAKPGPTIVEPNTKSLAGFNKTILRRSHFITATSNINLQSKFSVKPFYVGLINLGLNLLISF